MGLWNRAIDELKARADAVSLDLGHLTKIADASAAPGDVWLALVVLARRALKSTPQDEPMTASWHALLVPPVADADFEAAVIAWRGRDHRIGGHSVAAALLARTTGNEAEPVSDGILLLLLVTIPIGANPTPVRIAADASRLARTTYLWRQALLALPPLEDSFTAWLTRLVSLDPHALAQAHPGLPSTSVLGFASALSTLARLATGQLGGKPRQAQPARPVRPQPPQRAVRDTPDSPNWVRTRRVGTKARAPDDLASIAAERDADADSPNRRPPHLHLEYEPDSTEPDEPPDPVQLLLDLTLDEPLAQPALDTQVSLRRARAYRLLQLSARLPWHWDHLNPHDVAALRRGLAAAAEAPVPPAGALVAAVMLATGLPVTHVAEAPAPRSSRYLKPTYGPDRRWTGASAEHLLVSQVLELQLPWPQVVLDLARSRASARPGATKLAELLEDAPDLLAALLDWLAELRAPDAGLRLTHGRIARELSSAIRSICGAEWVVYAAAGTEDEVAPNAAYYSAMSSEQLAALHIQAQARIFGQDTAGANAIASVEPSGAGLVGARIARAGTVTVWIGELRSAAVLARDAGRSLVERHNAYARYVAWLLMAATGHRPVQDPLESISSFELEQGYCLIADKVVRQTHQARLVPLGELARQTVRAWIDHLRRLQSGPVSQGLKAAIASTAEPALAQGLPFLFLLEDLGNGISAVPIGKSELLASMGPLSALCANFFRRQLASMLSSCGIADELVRCVLGHEETGVDPLGSFSPHCGASLRLVGDRIDSWMRESGWAIIGSPLQDYPPAAPGQLSPVAAATLGSRSREVARRVAERRAVGQARIALANWLREARRTPVTQVALDELFRTLSPTRMLATRDPAAAELFGRAHDHCLRFIQRSELQRARLPQRLHVIRPAPPAFRQGDLGRVSKRQAATQAFRSILRERMRHGAPGKARRSAEFAVSLVLHSWICDPELLDSLLDGQAISLFQVQGLAAQMCLETTDGQGQALFTRRYPLHPATRQLLPGFAVPRSKADTAALRREFESLVQAVWARCDRSILAQPEGKAACIRYLVDIVRPALRLHYPAFGCGQAETLDPPVAHIGGDDAAQVQGHGDRRALCRNERGVARLLHHRCERTGRGAAVCA